jgi:hypothetical protein
MPPLPEFLTSTFSSGTPIDPVQVGLRLLLALVFGGIVVLVYRLSRPGEPFGGSFPATLVLLTILIAMVTQVIGDSVARAFSLVGALSIVRFRTVVRDTQDTAYVIFAVVVGMAIGASDPWVAVIGVAVVALAAMLLRLGAGATDVDLPYRLNVRLAGGLDPDAVLSPALDQYVPVRRMTSMATSRQGTSFDVSYRAALPAGTSTEALVKGLYAREGVLSVELQRAEAET